MRTRLTLIAAPAGFGKTTLATAYITEAAKHQAASDNPHFCWLSLDAGDNEFNRFFLYWIAALQTVAPPCGRQTQALLLSPQPTPPETLVTLLLNEMAGLATPTVLVLDDYHLITTPTIHDALALIIDRLPPAVHLLILSRSDPPLPLARWRVRGQLTEIRTADLRFTTDEAATFLNELMGLPLTAADLALLEARTEGWVAALQLAALSMQGQADIQSFLQSFTGGQRYVVDYLVDEVLSRQSPAIQRFLLQTSILDQFCAGLCATVVGEESAATAEQSAEAQAQAILEHLERSNLFLVPLDGERQWYRYHALFTEFLRHRLGAAAPALHRRAAAWYERHGFVAETIEHTLAAQDEEEAARFIETHSVAFALRHQLATVQGWLDALPAAWRHQRLGLALSEVWLMLGRGDVLGMERILTVVDGLVAGQPTALAPPIAGEVAAAHALVASFQQDHSTTIAYAQQALGTLPPQAQQLRLAVLSGLGYGYYCAGDLLKAEATLRDALAASSTAEGYVVPYITLLSMLAMVVEMQGRLQEAIDLLRQALDLGQVDGHYLPAAGVEVALHALGLRLYEFNALAEAEHYVRIARELSIATGNSMIQAHTLATLSLITQAKGDLPGAQALADEAHAVLRPLAVPSYAIIDAQRAFLWWKGGNLPATAAWAEDFGATMPARPQPLTAFATPYFSLARIWIAQERFAEADSLLADLYQNATANHYHYYALWALILQSQSYAAQGEGKAARTTLEQALRQAAPAGYLRSFIDEGEEMRERVVRGGWRNNTDLAFTAYIETLIAAFAPDPTIAPQPASPVNTPVASSAIRHPSPAPLIEPLSERELEVLRLLEQGLSNQAMADELIVALSTVKKHLINIYGKLGVNSRMQALIRARALGLL